VRGRTRRTVVMLATLAIAGGGSPARATCQVLDAACLVGETAAGAGGLVDVGSLETPVEDTVDPVEDTVDPVEDTVDPVVDTVGPVGDDLLDDVDDLLGGGGVDLPDPVGGGDDGGGDAIRPAGGNRRDTASHGPGRRGAAGTRVLGGHGFAEAPPTTISAASGFAPARPSFEGFGAALRGAARSLAIVFALFLLAIAFIAVQVRLDRKDPRLSLAPIESDVVEFA
jgi:hypothetical protein